MRRALAIQMIINRELGLNYNENPLQGAFLTEALTELVEEAVYQEFERLSARGGVLGAMETLYQRNQIQEESLYHEQRKHDGTLPIVGVNTFLGEDEGALGEPVRQLVRATDEEKRAQVEGLQRFKHQHAHESPQALARLQQSVRAGGNTFTELMQTVKHCTLGQITHALYAVGGQYRRRM